MSSTGTFLSICIAINGAVHPDAPPRIMSIYLPLGIALFQANNMQLLSIACLQERLLSGPETLALKVQRPARTIRSYWRRFNDLSLLKRTEAAVGIGMITQVGYDSPTSEMHWRIHLTCIVDHLPCHFLGLAQVCALWSHGRVRECR